MNRRLALVTASLVFAGACYHTTVETGAAPSGQVIDVPWANSFIAGLVPPATIESMKKCPNGVAKVESELSFLNMLANAITFGIYSPMHITVTCGTGRAASLPVVKGTSDVSASLQRAIDLSQALGSAVELDLK
ncbi:MAG: Bor family protein [Gemmatimonadaceae bacterium]|nr:Bor family protein [Gemmatimonadaceae bacterium]